MSTRARGFTLIELAVVIAVVGLLLAGSLAPLAARIQAMKARDTERALLEARDALIGFAVSRGRLPCPDTDADGAEDRILPVPRALPAPAAVPAPCAATSGLLPWQDLHAAPVDAWGRVLWYRVAPEFAFPTHPGLPPAPGRLDLADGGDILVITRGDDPGTAGLQTKSPIVLARAAPAVVFSTGSNGLGGADLHGARYAPPAAATDEARNAARPGAAFVSRARTDGAAPCDDEAEGAAFCAFDDQLVWVSTARLMGALLEAGQLP